MFVQTPQISAVLRLELIIILQYLDKLSKIVKTRITKSMSKHMNFANWELLSRLIIDLKLIWHF